MVSFLNSGPGGHSRDLDDAEISGGWQPAYGALPFFTTARSETSGARRMSNVRSSHLRRELGSARPTSARDCGSTCRWPPPEVGLEERWTDARDPSGGRCGA